RPGPRRSGAYHAASAGRSGRPEHRPAPACGEPGNWPPRLSPDKWAATRPNRARFGTDEEAPAAQSGPAGIARPPAGRSTGPAQRARRDPSNSYPVSGSHSDFAVRSATPEMGRFHDAARRLPGCQPVLVQYHLPQPRIGVTDRVQLRLHEDLTEV